MALPLCVMLCCTVAACGSDAQKSSDSTRSLVLPALRQTPSTNADASPPAVPFVSTTPVTVARARASFPHDTGAYTQGLLFADGRLLESTGGEGHSDLREVEPRTGRVTRRTALPAAGFGEGIAVAGDRLYQLTWKDERGFRFDVRTLALVDSFTYTGEGWGLTTMDKSLLMTDGSSDLRIVDPSHFREVRRVPVHEGDKAVWMLNELELVGDELWANIYETDLVARIRPATGEIIGYVDLGQLLDANEREGVTRRGGVANGIAYDPATHRVLVTGKMWPRLFELDLRAIPGLKLRD